jgi:cell division GTPase FtsZ
MINRRQLLLAVGASLYVTQMSRLLATERTEQPTEAAPNDGVPSAPVISVLGIGGFGCKIVEKIRREGVVRGTRSARIGRSHDERELDVRLDPRTHSKLSKVDTAAIREIVREADMVFMVAGFGGATGTRIAPLVAREARAAGAVVIALATEPFRFEGKRCHVARRGVGLLSLSSSRTIVFSNDELAAQMGWDTPVASFYERSDANVVRCLLAAISETYAPSRGSA